MNVADLQRALLARGFDPGPVDGQMGAKTRAAIRTFQMKSGLVVDGVAGPATIAKLVAATTGTPPGMPWMDTARRLIGTREIAGRAHNAEILSWPRRIGTRWPSLNWAVAIFTGDEVPWCGLFVAHCLAENGIAPDPSYPSALAWADWGQKLHGPVPGAICVKTRNGGGHVAFVEGRTQNGRLAILGGNQGNTVKVSPYARDAFTHYRYPPGIPAPRTTGFETLPIVGADGLVGQSER